MNFLKLSSKYVAKHGLSSLGLTISNFHLKIGASCLPKAKAEKHRVRLLYTSIEPVLLLFCSFRMHGVLCSVYSTYSSFFVKWHDAIIRSAQPRSSPSYKFSLEAGLRLHSARPQLNCYSALAASIY